MRYFIDCEFDGHGGPLLSMAVVRMDGASVYFIVPGPIRDPWVEENVRPVLRRHDPMRVSPVNLCLYELGEFLRHFIVDRYPIITADSPVDIWRFCEAISTGPDGGWMSTDYRHLCFEVHNVDTYPTDLPGAVQHNAWWDAMALRHRLTGD
jgi:hypothetical protein